MRIIERGSEEELEEKEECQGVPTDFPNTQNARAEPEEARSEELKPGN